MPTFGRTSTEHLAQADHRWRVLCHALIQRIDFSIRESFRDEVTQNKMLAEGKSKLHWPESAHNVMPSRALHLLPYPWPMDIPLDSRHARDRMHYFAGAVRMMGEMFNIPVRWGGDWDSDWRTVDNSFDDLMHFEITKQED